MKSVRIISLLCATIICGCIFLGCASKPVPVQEDPPPLMPKAQLVYPLRPIDQDIAEQVLESGDSLKRLQYYISDTLILMREKLKRNVEVRKGAGLQRETSATGQIVIEKETAGVLVSTYYGQDRRRVLAVSFEEGNDKDALFFLWNAREKRFILDYDAVSNLVGYGDQMYQVEFSGETPPFLLIRFSEEKITDPNRRVIKGRFIGPE